MNVADFVASKIDLRAYYDQYVRFLNTNRYKYSFKDNNLVVCPLHNDHDPSLGIVVDRRNKNILRYHCFGCGKSGNVIDLHREVQKLKGKSMTYQDTIVDLINLYNIEVPSDLYSQSKGYDSQLKATDNLIDDLAYKKVRFTPRDYTLAFYDIQDLKDSQASPERLAQEVDNLNIKLKESLVK